MAISVGNMNADHENPTHNAGQSEVLIYLFLAKLFLTQGYNIQINIIIIRDSFQ